MNTSQLECFVQVAENLSFRRAAEELHLSQPTVSKQVAAIEAELGGALFVRTTREVMLTALGESFVRDAREILRLTYAAGERARRAAEGCALAIAYSDSNELMRLEPVLDRLRQEREGLHVLFAQGSRDTNLGRLVREQVDAVLGFKPETPVAGVTFVPLIEDGLTCIVRIDSPLADRASVGPEDVGGMSQILVCASGLRRRGYAAQAAIPSEGDGAAITCSTSSEAYCLVDAGFGYALVPTLYTMPDPFHKRLAWNVPVSVSYGLYQRETERSSLPRRLVELAVEVYGQPGFGRPVTESWRPAADGRRTQR